MFLKQTGAAGAALCVAVGMAYVREACMRRTSPVRKPRRPRSTIPCTPCVA